jgi:hypothetical protein
MFVAEAIHTICITKIVYQLPQSSNKNIDLIHSLYRGILLHFLLVLLLLAKLCHCFMMYHVVNHFPLSMLLANCGS